jgi:limonene-1,2-epoxide hydrolase
MNHQQAELVVNDFLLALQAKDHDKIAALLAPDLQYTNVSLPTIVGGQRVAHLFEILLRRGTGFEVEIHSIAAKGDVVMTERTDVLKVGSLHVAFWVCGTFRVQNGQIVLWRDYFDWLDISKGMLRGVAGIFIPKFRISLINA